MVTVLQRSLEDPASVPTGPPSGPLLQSVLAARSETYAFLEGSGLQDAVRTLAEAAHSMGHTVLHGASAEGHVFAGAMAFYSSELRLWIPGRADAVLLIDGVLAGTAGLAAAAKSVRAIGATRVDALALGILSADAAAIPLGVDRLKTVR